MGEENERGLALGFHPALILSRCGRGQTQTDAEELVFTRLFVALTRSESHPSWTHLGSRKVKNIQRLLWKVGGKKSCSCVIGRARMTRRGKCSQEAGALMSFIIGIL